MFLPKSLRSPHRLGEQDSHSDHFLRREEAALELIRHPTSDAAAARDLFDHARALSHAGSEAESVEMISRVVESFRPLSSATSMREDIMLGAAQVMSDLGDGDSARAILRLVSTRGELQRLYHEAELSIGEGEYSKALSVLEEMSASADFAAERDGFNQEVRLLTAIAHTSSGNFAVSDAILQSMSDIGIVPGEYRHAIHRICSAWNAAGQEHKSFGEVLLRPEYKLALRPDEQSIPPLLRGWAVFQGRDFLEAAKIFSRFRSPEDAFRTTSDANLASLEGEGYSFMAAGQSDRALEAFTQYQDQLKLHSRENCFSSIAGGVELVKLLFTSGQAPKISYATALRRRAQLVLGQRSPQTVHIMGYEAEALLEYNLVAQSGEIRLMALRSLSRSGLDRSAWFTQEIGLLEVNSLNQPRLDFLNRIQALKNEILDLKGVDDRAMLRAEYTEHLLVRVLEVEDRSLAVSATEALLILNEKVKHEFGVNHVFSNRVMYLLGQTYQSDGMAAEAGQIFSNILSGLSHSANRGERAADILVSRAECYHDLGDFQGASESYSEAAEILDRVDRVDPRRVQSLIVKQANELVLCGSYKVARKLYKSSWTTLATSGDHVSELYLSTVEGNAKCLERLGDHRGAAFNYERVLRIVGDRYNKEKIFRLRVDLAWNYEMADNLPMAFNHYEEAIDLVDSGMATPSEIDSLVFRSKCCAVRTA